MSEKTKVLRTLEGTVVSNKGEKTIVVRFDRIERHPTYHKVVRRSNKVHAHDEDNVCNIGDVVTIAESRPISKLKSWVLKDVVQKAAAE